MENLDRKTPDIIVVKIPNFRAVTSRGNEWSELMSWGWHENHKHFFDDIIFNCNHFLVRRIVDGERRGEFVMAIKDFVTEADVTPFEIIDFEGGLYAMSVSIDGDMDSVSRVEEKIFRWIEHTNFEADESRSIMGHMNFNNDEIKAGLGYEQLLRFVPIKLSA